MLGLLVCVGWFGMFTPSLAELPMSVTLKCPPAAKQDFCLSSGIVWGTSDQLLYGLVNSL